MAESTSYTVETFAADDGYRWRFRHYAPAGPLRGHVVCLHGIQSHAGWYGYSCGRLSAAGYAVSFVDRRGSGMNQKDRGDARNFRRLLTDVEQYLEKLGPRSEPRVVPTFLVGISWGGKLATALEAVHPGLVDGLVLLCPGFCARVRPRLKERLAIAWARLVNPRRRFPIPLDDPGLFTATPRWQEFIRNDRLSLREATSRLLFASVRLDRFLRQAAGSVRIPVLVMLAGQDRIIDNRRTRRFVERFGSADKQIIEYPEAHHTLEFEPDPDRFLGDVIQWLDRHAARGTPHADSMPD